MSTATFAPITGQNLIGGQWQGPDGVHFPSHNPARYEEVE